VQVWFVIKNTTEFVEKITRFLLTVNIRDKIGKFVRMDIPLFMQNWDASLAEEKKKALKNELAFYINDLLLHRFEKLVEILYRVDVSQKKLKTVLLENKEKDAGDLIADLLIKRQEEKIAFRRSIPPANNITDDERW